MEQSWDSDGKRLSREVGLTFAAASSTEKERLIETVLSDVLRYAYAYGFLVTASDGLNKINLTRPQPWSITTERHSDR